MTSENTHDQATGQSGGETGGETAAQKFGCMDMMMRMCCAPSADRESGEGGKEGEDNARGCCCGPFKR